MIHLEHRFNTSIKPLLVGLTISIICTLAAYFIISHQILRPYWYLAVIAGLGFFQMLVQLVLFLHLGVEPRPKWSFWMFLLMLFVILVVIGGSLWIMDQLNYYVMPK